MGLAAEPICGVATPLLDLVFDILSSDYHGLRFWDEQPVDAVIIGKLCRTHHG